MHLLLELVYKKTSFSFVSLLRKKPAGTGRVVFNRKQLVLLMMLATAGTHNDRSVRDTQK